MKIPRIDGFEEEYQKVEDAILERNRTKKADYIVNQIPGRLTDYARALLKEKMYIEAEPIVIMALEDDSQGIYRHAIKMLLDIYINTDRIKQIADLKKWTHSKFIEKEITEIEDGVNIKLFMKTITKLKKEPNLYIEAMEKEAKRIGDKHHDDSMTLYLESIKYLIKIGNYETAWDKLGKLIEYFLETKQYSYLSKAEKIRAKISEEEGRYKDSFFELVCAEIYSHYSGYLFYNEQIPRYEELNGHPVQIYPISLEKMKCDEIIEKAGYTEIAKEVIILVNICAENDGIKYVNAISKVKDYLKNKK